MSQAIRSSLAVFTLCFALAAGAEQASGSQVEIIGTARQQTVACTGATEVSIKGASNDITLTGDCKSVSVRGSANKVSIDTVGRIEVKGTANNVSWKKASGSQKKPKVNSAGVDNKVFQAR
jgi:hypothetical protein